MIKTVNILIGLSCLLLMFSCRKTADRQDNIIAQAIEVSDFRGKTISLNKPAERIVCLIESALSGLYMLGAENQVIGISTNVYTDKIFEQYSLIDKRIREKQIPAPGNWDFINLEKVLSLKPDLVIIWASQDEAIRQMETHGIQVYGVMLKSIDDIYKEISDLGLLTGKEARADSLITYSKKQLNQISEMPVPAGQKKKVYFAWAQGLTETSGTKSTVNELITLAGAVNACPLPEEHLTVNIERIFDWNPGLIVLWYNESMEPDELQNISGWNSLPAVKSRQVFELPSVFYCDLWTLKFQFAVRLLHHCCYPEQAGTFNPEEEKRQMLDFLYGEKAKFLK